MGIDIIQRLTSAEDDILDALTGQDPDLSLFEKTWSSLQHDFELAMLHEEVRPETVSFAHIVASRVGRIASCFLELEQTNLELKNKLQGDFDHILSNVDTVSLSPTASRSPSPSPSHHLHSLSSSPNSLISEAYAWLLKNIANPYPLLTLKTSLAQRYGCSVSAVSSWFVNARRRMGWTALCRDHFHGSRADAVDAARRVFVQEDPKRLLSPEIIHAFMVMKVTAEGLYSSTFTKSALAGDLDAVVKDMTKDRTKVNDAKPDVLVEILQEFKAATRGGCTLDSQLQGTLAEHSYPSPQCSSSPVPALDDSFTDESEDEEDVSPPMLAGRKRRSSSSELHHAVHPTSTIRPIKRLRTSPSTSSISSFTSDAGLPSPSTSVDGHCPDQIPFPVTTQTCTNPTVPDKRRLPTYTPDIPKRSHSRLHVAQDPLPRPRLESECSIDEWFNTNFDALFTLPHPVEDIEPDLSTPWEVELFNKYSLPQNSQRRSLKSFLPPVQAPQTSSPELVELESLLEPVKHNRSVECSETTAPSNTDLAPQELSLSSSASQSVDWTTLLHSEEFLVPTVDSVYHPSAHSQPLSGIDLSVLQLPDITPTTRDLSSKQAKLRQLQVMQEAVRRMERELQSEGITI